MVDNIKQTWIINWCFGTHGVCTYCGAGSECIDHVVPVSWFHKTGVRNEGTRYKGIRTFSCNNCNKVLGNRYFESFKDRCQWVEDHYRTSYRKIARLDPWDESELASLRGKLKKYVKAKESERIEITRRAEWPFSDSYFKNIVDLVDQPAVTLSSPKAIDWLYRFFESTIIQIKSLYGIHEHSKSHENALRIVL
jgi:hypothetical protein